MLGSRLLTSGPIMRLSLFSVPISGGPDSDRAIIFDVIDRAALADSLGFFCLYYPEHHFDDYCPWADNMLLVAHLAATVRRAHLGLSIAIAPFHHPVALAERAALMSQLTDGKFILGVGSGGVPLESTGMGFDPATQGEELESIVVAVEKLWAKRPADPPVDFSTRRYAGKVVQRIMPASAGSPPVIKLACVRPDRALLAATKGWAVFTGEKIAPVYVRALLDAGHAEETVARCLAFSSISVGPMHVAETDTRARAELIAALQTRQQWLDRQKILETRHNLGNPLMVPAPDYASEAYLSSRCLYGSPATVLARMRSLARLGFGEILGESDVGLNTPERMAAVRRSITMLGQEVIPALNGIFPAKVQEAAASVDRVVRAEVHPAFGEAPRASAG